MINQYADIRAALGAGPTPGPWANRANQIGPISREDDQSYGMLLPIAYIEEYDWPIQCKANAAYIAAANPDVIRDLLADYDRMRVALMTIKEWPITGPLNMDDYNMQAVAHDVLLGDEDGW